MLSAPIKRRQKKKKYYYYYYYCSMRSFLVCTNHLIVIRLIRLSVIYHLSSFSVPSTAVCRLRVRRFVRVLLSFYLYLTRHSVRRLFCGHAHIYTVAPYTYDYDHDHDYDDDDDGCCALRSFTIIIIIINAFTNVALMQPNEKPINKNAFN